MAGVVARREQVGNNAITPIISFRKHQRAHTKRSAKRQENQPQQDGKDWFAIKHCCKDSHAIKRAAITSEKIGAMDERILRALRFYSPAGSLSNFSLTPSSPPRCRR